MEGVKMKKIKNFTTLSKMPREDILQIWRDMFNCEPNANKGWLIKAIWYKHKCKVNNEKISQKNITKLNRYSINPEKFILKAKKYKYEFIPGSVIKKRYKEKNYEVKILSQTKFEYAGKIYDNLSIIASNIAGHKVSGNDFFGFRKRG